MKTLCIIILGILFCSSSFGQMDTIPTRFYGVAENESYTYISTNTGLYILERDSNNTFGEIHNKKDSLGILYIHRNYLISGDDYRLKIFNIAIPTNPLLILDTLINYPVSEFEDFNQYFVIRLKLATNKYKFLLADIINSTLQIIFDSDLANPSFGYFRRGSEFYYPYAFLNFDDWPSPDTLITYRYELTQNSFNRLSQIFIFTDYFIVAGAFNDILFTAGWWLDLYGEENFYQRKYDIDTTSNTFNYITQYHYFARGPENVNSFAITSTSQQSAMKYDFSFYERNSSPPTAYTIKQILTDNNLYRAYIVGQGPESLEYSFRVTEDSIIYKLIDFNPTTVNEYNDIVRNFQLHQNYPNPFNPSTKIKYTIPEHSFVTLNFYDVLGNEVEILVREEKPAGTYEVKFDGSSLPSGVYFYQLQTGNFVQIKKMLLLK